MKKRGLWKDMRGDAVVEAAILLPIMMMIFAGLVLLALYLPSRALLQRATQYAATAISVQESDTWLRVDGKSAAYSWVNNKDDLHNVYVQFFGSAFETQAEREEKRELAEDMVKFFQSKAILSKSGELEVDCDVRNYVIYKEVTVTATYTVTLPVDLTFVGLAKKIPITVSSTAVVQNGDEFVRNMDLINDYLHLDKLGESLSKVFEFMGIK